MDHKLPYPGSKRSACDRCRGRKVHCIRDHHHRQDHDQLQHMQPLLSESCRGCSLASVECTTTSTVGAQVLTRDALAPRVEPEDYCLNDNHKRLWYPGSPGNPGDTNNAAWLENLDLIGGFDNSSSATKNKPSLLFDPSVPGLNKRLSEVHLSLSHQLLLASQQTFTDLGGEGAQSPVSSSLSLSSTRLRDVLRITSEFQDILVQLDQSRALPDQPMILFVLLCYKQLVDILINTLSLPSQHWAAELCIANISVSLSWPQKARVTAQVLMQLLDNVESTPDLDNCYRIFSRSTDLSDSDGSSNTGLLGRWGASDLCKMVIENLDITGHRLELKRRLSMFCE
ncbi:hypothetical protein F4779DRAFT_195432 [Xylariaceae sp. FL0662B]|nr:hypothetical protein F4779DRAFT_195432 [Xylariaceae sp. FL0662B]